MTLADSILGPVKAATTSPYKDWDNFWYQESIGAPVLAGVSVGPDTAMQQSAIAASVRIISGTVAKVPFPVYRRLNEDAREKVRKHTVYKLLNSRPNPWQTAFEFRRQLTAHVAMRGNGYARVEGQIRPTALIPMHPDRVKPEQISDTGELVYHVRQDNGEVKTLASDDVLHVRDLTLDGITGLSRIQQAKQGIGLAMAAEYYGASFFGNGAEAAIALMTDGSLTQEQRDAILAGWTTSHGGPFNRHKPTVLEGGLKVEKLTQTNKESQLLELRSFQVEDIARWYGLPPHLLGQTEKQTSYGTGVEQMSIGFLTYHMLDWFVMWETAVHRDLFLPSEQDDHFAEHILDGLLRADFKTRMDGFQIGIQNGIYNADEVRQKLNENPRADGRGSVYWRPANMEPDDGTVRRAAPDGPPVAAKSNGGSTPTIAEIEEATA